jgi:hypothetical protein
MPLGRDLPLCQAMCRRISVAGWLAGHLLLAVQHMRSAEGHQQIVKSWLLVFFNTLPAHSTIEHGVDYSTLC